MEQAVERGKPAEYGQEIVKRRARITSSYVPLAGKSVLDFGSGNGAQTIELAKEECRIVACDIDAADIEVLREYIRGRNIRSVYPLVYDGRRLPLSDSHFDVVVCYAVLEHVQEEGTALEEIRRVLKPSGTLVISVPNKWWVFETHGARLPLLPWNRVPFFSWLPKSIHGRYARARIYSRQQIINLLVKNGFQVLQSCYMTAPMDVVKPPAFQKMLRAIIFRKDRTRCPVMATEVFVNCRKEAGG